MVCRIGYLVPEFPGQTHAFFWREVHALEGRGIEVDLVSTRRPDAGLISQPWADSAMRRTTYLAPMGVAGVLGGAAQILAAGPSGWWRMARAIAGACDVSPRERLHLIAMGVVGARLAGLAWRRGWRHLHVHSCGDSANAALFANLLGGARYGLTLHGPLSFFGPNQRQKWRHADFAFCVARALREEAGAALGSDLPAVVEVVPMGVDVDGFARASDYQPWNGQGACTIFSCGRLNPGKGQDDLIRAVAHLQGMGLPVRLRIAGEDDTRAGDCRLGLERLIADLGLDDEVRLLGAVGEDEVRNELQKANLFALASHEEALGVATMEAMAMSLPVVVTGVGGVPELVGDGVEGLLVPARAPRAMAEAIARVMHDPALAVRMGRAGRAKVAQGFHSSRSAELMVRLLGPGPTTVGSQIQREGERSCSQPAMPTE
jgi:colanic acid/amylovoran biosynthesis glycosyltransferase